MRRGPSNPLIALKVVSLAGELTGTEKRVAAAIIDHHNHKTRQCDPALTTIANLLGIDRRTAIRAIGKLVRIGFLKKIRHGGKFHRNSYAPDWCRFNTEEKKWMAHRAAVSRASGSNVSPSQGQACQLGGDAAVTQTSSNNLLKETLLTGDVDEATRTSCKRTSCRRLGKEENRDGSQAIAIKRFHVKPAGSRVAARDAAERRWNRTLMARYAKIPELYGLLVDAIDDQLKDAATASELRTPGSGLRFILETLRSRLPSVFLVPSAPSIGNDLYLRDNDPQAHDVLHGSSLADFKCGAGRAQGVSRQPAKSKP